MHREETRLLNKIAASPWSDAPRLEYAAWIERHADKSRSAQAEFLRLDIERAQLDPLIHYSGGYSPGQYDRYWEVRERLQDIDSSLDPAWLIRVDRDLAIPPELSERGNEAARLILNFLLAERLTGTCGCRAFYSPKEWKQRGEEYGHNSLLILVYDGGDITTCIDPAKGQHDLVDRFMDNLDRNGFVIEPCTDWYSAIYDEDNYEPFAIGLG